jgi:hypothetical protein
MRVELVVGVQMADAGQAFQLLETRALAGRKQRSCPAIARIESLSELEHDLVIGEANLIDLGIRKGSLVELAHVFLVVLGVLPALYGLVPEVAVRQGGRVLRKYDGDDSELV